MFHVMILSLVISFGISALLGLWLIPVLRKLKYGQTILDVGPSWHKSKQGTPTMGGLMFIAGITASILCCMFFYVNQYKGDISSDRLMNARVFAGLVSSLLFGLIGFGDDFVKVSHKSNDGFTAKQKMVLQFVVAFLYLWWLYAAGDRATNIFIPFFGSLELGFLYFPLCAVGMVFIVNSVNLTDGLDGLDASVTAVCALGFLLVSVYLKAYQNAILCCAVIGGMVAFLIYNAYPAKVFMGDTGSLFLGGMVIAMAFGVRLPIFLIFCGIIYIVESLTVIIQVWSIRKRGKKIFKMTPIHHHFEMSGYSERKIVAMFSSVTAIGAILAYFAVRLL